MTRRHLIVLIVILAGCGREFATRVAPRHHVVVFDNQSAEPQVRRTCLAWLDGAVDRPGSSLTICVAGRESQGRCAAPIITPASQPHLLRVKASFRRELPTILDATLRGRSKWSRAADDLGNGTTLAVVSGVDLPPARWAQVEAAASQPPISVIVLADVSASAVATVYDVAELRADYDRFLVDGGMAPRSSFAIMRIGRDLSSTREVFRFEMPTEKSVAFRTLAALSARQSLERISLLDPTAGSSVIEATYIAGEILRDMKDGNRLRLILRSDLQQVTRGRWDFAREVPTAASFIEDLQREHLMPTLIGVQVEVCGTHFRGTQGRTISARTDAALKATWEETLSASGAQSVQFSARCIGGAVPVAQEGE